MAITSSSILAAVSPALGEGIRPVVGLRDVAFARSTIGTAVDMLGVVRTVPARTPRFEWVDVDGELRQAAVVERAATNLVPAPEGGAASYTFRSGGVTDGGWTSGGLSGGIRLPRSASTEYAYQVVPLAGSTTYTISVDAELDDGSVPVVRSASAGQAASHFTFFCGEVLAGAVRIRRLRGTNVYRFSATVTTASSVARQEAGFVRYPDQLPGGLRLTTLQVEAAPAESSRIRTTGARLADTLSFTGLARKQPLAWYLDYVARQPNGAGLGSSVVMQFGATSPSTAPGRLYVYQHNGLFLTTTYNDAAGVGNSHSVGVTIQPGDRVQYAGVLYDTGARRSAVRVGGGTLVQGSTAAPAGGVAPAWSAPELHFGSATGSSPCSMGLLRMVAVRLGDLSSSPTNGASIFEELAYTADRLRPDGRLHGEV